jgi:hypothetical protein
MSIQLLQATEVVFKPHTFIYLISISSWLVFMRSLPFIASILFLDYLLTLFQVNSITKVRLLSYYHECSNNQNDHIRASSLDLNHN